MVRRAAYTLILLATISAAYAGGARESNNFLIEVAALEQLLSGSQPLILDIRDDASYRKGHIPGAILVPLNDIERLGPEFVALNRSIVTYCSCPAEESSLSAALKLRDLGAGTVHVLQGGYPAWIREKKSVVTGSNPT